jgi:hypothetical protein
VIFVGIVNKNVFSVIFYEILFLAESWWVKLELMYAGYKFKMFELHTRS